MNPELKKIVRRGIFSLAMAAVCAGGIWLAGVRNAENAPEVQSAAASQTPVIVLDAGPADQLKLSSKITESSPFWGASSMQSRGKSE